MRTPSRRMPKRQAPSRVSRVVFFGLSGVAVLGIFWCFTIQALLLLGLGGALIGIWVRATTKAARMRFSELAASRDGESICQFARSFDTRRVDTWIIRAVYEALQEELAFAHPSIPVRASDTLPTLLIDPDALDMAVAPEVARRTGRSLDHIEANPYYGRVKSVRDLVMCFNEQPKALA